MKAISSVFTILGFAGVLFSIAGCGSNNSNSSASPGTVVATTGCVYTAVGLLPQGSCPAGQGQIITMANGVNAGYTQGQCLPQVAAQNGAYGNTGYGYGTPGYGAPGYGTPGYGAPGYGTTGYGYDGGQCAGQTGVNGINGQCVQTSFGCLPQCPGQPGSLQYQGNCAPYSYFGASAPGGIPPYGYGPYAPSFPGYIPGGGGNFGGYYGFNYYRGI